ncbi:hypothetical protein [Devosia beringensis]|uniref:hypothetical protein n=1 Tax=Devosia beringensis TaxID=2657486 RepID=UPI00186BA10E|nr:hypothetical protein [Devosia beringensis]
MISPVMPHVALSGSIAVQEVRQRPAAGERPILADSTPTVAKSSTASNGGQFPKSEAQPSEDFKPSPPDRDRTSTFAAAVIAGALSPTPQTMEQLIIRIGASIIPEESQARLKDLIA